MEYPPYSVLMSVYKKENPNWFKIALDSMLAQTVKPAEIVLVEDGPLTKALYNVIEEYKTKYKNLFKIVPLKENQGLGLALQQGILACNNEYIARMDTDDYCVKERCSLELNEFIKDPELDIVGCFENEFAGEDLTQSFSCHKVPETDAEIKKFMRRRCGLLHPTVIYKKSAVLKAGNYRHYPLFEDYDLFLRMVESGAKTYNIQKSLYYLRVNPNLFKRRGGYAYMKTCVSFKYALYKKGFSSFMDFTVSAFGQALVCLMPNFMRTLFYKKFLRRE